MRQWSTALLPLSILMALAALTFWLRYVTELPEGRHDGKNRHDPDLIVQGATARKLDASGRLLYTLVAQELRHYPDDDTTDLSQPRLVYLQPDKPPVTISAAKGHVTTKGERVDLKDNVQVRRAASDTRAELVLETAELTVLTDEERGFTKSPVVITEGNSWLQGVGMQIDHKLQTYLLESQVSGRIESHLVKKK
mgnify:FL=1